MTVSTPCLFFCNRCSHAESHQQERAQKLCSAIFPSSFFSFTKWSNLIGCCAYQRIVIESSGPFLKTYSESKTELQNLQILKMVLAKSSQFLSSEQPCELKSLVVALNTDWRSWKNTFGKLEVAVNTGGHSIRVLNKRSVLYSDCGWRIVNQFGIVSKTSCSCDTVGRELQLAVLGSLLCPETDWKIPVWKQGYVFILTDFKKTMFLMFHSWLINLYQQLFWDWEFLK